MPERWVSQIFQTDNQSIFILTSLYNLHFYKKQFLRSVMQKETVLLRSLLVIFEFAYKYRKLIHLQTLSNS